MIELLMILIMPTEINPEKMGMKLILKEKFISYESCKEYVDKNMYLKPDDQQGLYYKVDSKEYKVFLTYCKPVDKQWNGLLAV